MAIALLHDGPAGRVAAPAPGHLRLVRAKPNPAGSLDALYLAVGDALAAPIAAIDPITASDDASGIDLSPREGSRVLRILHFNDLHNALHAQQGASTTPLFSRIVGRYRRARAVAAPDEIVLLLSGGDDHTGTPFDELLGWTASELVVDPAYAAYSAAGVEAATLGNHDLDRGSGVLAAGIAKSANFPILSANVHGSASLVQGHHYFPAAIAVAHGLRIGFIGLTTPIDTRVATTADPSLAVAMPLTALRNLLPAIAARSDIVIVMSHCGYGLDSRAAADAAGVAYLAEGDVAIARFAAALTERPVIVLGGHTHTVLNANGFGPDTLIDGVPIVQAGGHGSHLGEVGAKIALGGTRREWKIGARLHPLRGNPRGGADSQAVLHYPDADRSFESGVLAPLLAQVQSRIDEVVGVAGRSIALSRERTLRDRYCGECALANFICDTLVARSHEFPQGPVDLAIVNATAIADGLPRAGPITFKDWYRVQPFADCLQVARLSGTQLDAILQSNARRIVRPNELSDPAIDLSGYVSRGFLHFSKALRYTLRLGTSARAAMATDITVGGARLADMPDATFRVVFTNYVGAGGYAEAWNGNPIGGGVPGALPGCDLRSLPRLDTGLVFRNEVIAYIRGVGRIDEATGAVLDGRLAVI